MIYAQWKEKRGKRWSRPYWRKAKSAKTAKEFEREWNKFDNPYDKLKLIKVSSVLPTKRKPKKKTKS